MAKPQIEDGHAKIANELCEALAQTYLNPSESKVLWAIIRKTYGYHKKTDRISYTQFEEMTKMDKWHITPIIKRLIDRQIISRSGVGYRLEYSLQKNYENWKSLPVLEKSLPEQVIPLSPLVPSIPPTKASTKASTKAKEILPDWIDIKVWDDFWDFRKKIKFPKTDGSVKVTLEDLEKYRSAGDDPNAVLKQSMSRGWRGVFRLKEDIQKRGNGNGENRRPVEPPGGRPYTNEELQESVDKYRG